jgi:hypothetical protein
VVDGGGDSGHRRSWGGGGGGEPFIKERKSYLSPSTINTVRYFSLYWMVVIR